MHTGYGIVLSDEELDIIVLEEFHRALNDSRQAGLAERWDGRSTRLGVTLARRVAERLRREYEGKNKVR